jgi:PAS domain S-box-containing protein
MDNELVTVLLVEDDPDHAELIRHAFDCNRKDIRLELAASLAEAQEKLATLAPSVVLCDYLLPDGSGLQLLRQFAASSRAMPPFVLLTSHGDETVAVEAMKAGATDYIVKSEKSLTMLPDICRALIGGYRQRLEKERLELERLRLFEQLQESKRQLQAQYDELRFSEARFLSVTESAPDAIVSTDANGRIIFFNHAAGKMFGIDKGKAVGQPAGILMPPHSRAAHRAGMARWQQSGAGAFSGQIYTLFAQRQSGEEFPIELSLTSYSKQKERYFIAIVRDLTERKSQEAALLISRQRLQKSEQLLNRAQEMAHIGCWELDLAAQRLYWSDEVYRIFGVDPQTFQPSYQSFIETVHPEDRERVEGILAASATDGLGGYEMEYRIVRQNSREIRFVHGKCDHLKGPEGEVERWVGIVHDVTEQRQMESSLFESELRYRTLANSGQALIWTSGTDKLCNYFNEPWLAFTGRTLQQELGSGWTEGVHPEDLEGCLATYLTSFDLRRHGIPGAPRQRRVPLAARRRHPALRRQGRVHRLYRPLPGDNRSQAGRGADPPKRGEVFQRLQQRTGDDQSLPVGGRNLSGRQREVLRTVRFRQGGGHRQELHRVAPADARSPAQRAG